MNRVIYSVNSLFFSSPSVVLACICVHAHTYALLIHKGLHGCVYEEFTLQFGLSTRLRLVQLQASVANAMSLNLNVKAYSTIYI